MNKKAISPVVATALLLVVAVVAVVGFQTWFASYQSSVEAQVEDQAETGVAVSSERVEGNVEVNTSEHDNYLEFDEDYQNTTAVYLSAGQEVEISSLSVGDQECGNDLDEYPSVDGLQTFYCDVDSSDLDNQVELLIEGDDQVYSFTEIVR